MKNTVKTIMRYAVLILVILFCAFNLYRINVISKREQADRVEEIEQQFTLEKENEDNHVLDLGKSQLEVSGILYIPKIDLTIPIYNSTSELALSEGTGIVGGTGDLNYNLGQNTIVTSHNGQDIQDLFINLEKLELDDSFYIKYPDNNIKKFDVVDRLVLEPENEYENIPKYEDKSLITLRTCVPLGINSHRLLVVGEDTNQVVEILPETEFTLSQFEIINIIGIIISGVFIVVDIIKEIKYRKTVGIENEKDN